MIIRALGPQAISVTDLARLTGCSAVTIRRDLAELERQGGLKRVHGGAVAAGSRGTPMPYSLRAAERAAEKGAIARTVARIVRDDTSVILDNGSTLVAVAEELAGRPVTVLCLSLRAASALGSAESVDGAPVTAIATPRGVVEGGGQRYGGAACLEALDAFRADVAVVGACSASPAHGLSVTTSEDARVKRAIIASSVQVVLAATGDKLSRTSSFRFGDLEDIDHLVTTADVSDSVVEDVRAAGVAIHIAE